MSATAAEQLFDQLQEQMLAEQFALSAAPLALPTGFDLEPPTALLSFLGPVGGLGTHFEIQPEVLAVRLKPLGPGVVPAAAKATALGRGVPFAIAVRFRMLSLKPGPLATPLVASVQFCARHQSTQEDIALGQTQVKVHRLGAEQAVESAALRLHYPGTYQLQVAVTLVGTSQSAPMSMQSAAKETRLIEIV
ncbi:MAG TPA: hypothetical protein V6D06_11520 [Trichocoleus sp.]